MRLILTQNTQKQIQTRVNQLINATASFNLALNRSYLFFPLITKILTEEKIPEDFKFQAMHESMLSSDAISHTNDVGFWQIHKIAAQELQLQIDHPVDERMHIIQSTKAAARFLRGHAHYFNSWLGALLAYHRGRVGAIKRFAQKYYGSKKIRIDNQTDPYILAVIATKIAFEQLAGKQKHPKWRLHIYEQGHQGHQLQEIATHLKIEKTLLVAHNKWLKTDRIPDQTRCALIVPCDHAHNNLPPILKLNPISIYQKNDRSPMLMEKTAGNSQLKLNFPSLTAVDDPRSHRLIKANGRLAIIAQKGDTIDHLAKLVNLPIDKFLCINEIARTDQLLPDTVYYYQKKGSKGGTHYHIVTTGENIWHIAQRYGMTQSALLEKNRMKAKEALLQGNVLWLRFIRPRNTPITYKPRKKGAKQPVQ